MAATAIGVFDLKLIGPLFPAIEALSFWPQMADHIMWGLAVGLVLWWRDTFEMQIVDIGVARSTGKHR